jgi:low temperature requirement protein LtrA
LTERWPGWIVRAREDRPRVSYLELLFDLGLIVALSRVSQRLVEDLSWYNALQTAVLLGAIWWVWTVTAYTTDWYDPELPVVQVIVLGVLAGGLLMAAAVPGAFENTSNAFAFAGAYIGLHLFRGVILVTALRGHQLRLRPLRVFIWFAITGVVWLVGAALPSGPRLTLWIVALVVDYTVGRFGYRLLGLGSASPEDLRIVGEHVSERYRQMFVVSLGELLLVGGIRISSVEFGSYETVSLVLLLAAAVAFWRLYLVYVGRHLATGIEASPNPGVTALVAAYAHLMMVAGIAATAAGGELLLSQPVGRTSTPAMFVYLGGPLLFLIGRSLYAIQVYRVARWRHLAGIVAILALTPALVRLPPVGVVALVNAVLLLIGFAPGRIPRTLRRLAHW